MLIRRFVNASFVLFIKNEWSSTLCEEHNTILRSAGGPLWCVAKFLRSADGPLICDIAPRILGYHQPYLII